ncbi:TRAP transporter small permease [Clostridiaceae bacterium]|jgi:TRAP-type C4-dicarboxylate transport system permease small subunit|nr:TRAP transporter small permease [Clostridium sp.]NBI72386.1 TRAP transporter small permease [Clostridiaceae bacterium]
MGALHAFRKGLNSVLNTACALLFAAMVLIGTYQIVTRFVFRSPSTVSEELLTYSFTWMALLAAAYVFGKMDHMRMGFLADKFSREGRRILSIAAEILILLLAGSVMIYGGFSIMKLTMTQSTASLGIPMGVVYAVIPIAGILIAGYSILNIIDLAAGVSEVPGGETKARKGGR